jgi:hypothetical protein
MTAGLITCGALAREVRSLIARYGWDAEIIGVPAVDHVFPERIGPHVEERIQAWKDHYQRLIVVYGDCGSRGALDAVLDRHPEIERIPGPHCYAFYAEETFDRLMAEEPGSYFLTDFMVRTFNGLIKKSMGLDRYPELKEDYFRNYRRVVYLAQTQDPELVEKARTIAEELGLPLVVERTGLGNLEKHLVSLLEDFKTETGKHSEFTTKK